MKQLAQVGSHNELLGEVGFVRTASSFPARTPHPQSCVAMTLIITCGFSILDFEDHFKGIDSRRTSLDGNSLARLFFLKRFFLDT